MGGDALLALWAAIILFGTFTANVAMGSISRAAFLGNVGEMLVLLGASVAFVVGVLSREADAARRGAGDDLKGGRDIER